MQSADIGIEEIEALVKAFHSVRVVELMGGVKTTLNTGTVTNARTVEKPEWI